MRIEKLKLKGKQQRAIWLSIVAVVLCIVAIALAHTFGATKGYITDSGLRLRTEPVNGQIITHLSAGTEVEILSEKKVGGTTWYQVHVQGQTGYISGDFVSGVTNSSYEKDDNFEVEMSQQGFPESYKPALRRLHTNHPNWKFVAQQTNLNWDAVIEKESKPGVNLVHQSEPAACKSTDRAAYDPVTGQYRIFDNGGWVAASKQMVSYFMDPRNFLNEGGVFQFVSHQFFPDIHTKEDLEGVLAGTFMASSKGFPEAGYSTYNEILYEAGKQTGVNPMTLASMIIQEQGITGYGASISGNHELFPGYYNYFNIGAFPAGGYSAVAHGLWTAQNNGWNTRAKSIFGGAKWYADNYVGNNKSTFYLKKFNVMNGYNSVATGQYMTNVKGAYSEGVHFAKGFDSKDSTPITFAIPVFNNMPWTPCAYPTANSNVNYLSALSVKGHSLTPTFNPNETDYELVVSESINSVTIEAVASDKSAKIKGAGKISLEPGTNNVKVVCTSSSGIPKTYSIAIFRKGNGSDSSDSDNNGSDNGSGNNNPGNNSDNNGNEGNSGNSGTSGNTDNTGNAGTGGTGNSGNSGSTGNAGSSNSGNIIAPVTPNYTIDTSVTGIKPGTSVSQFVGNFTLDDGKAEVVSSRGVSIIGKRKLATGMILKIYNKNNIEISSSPIVIYGDINGDGNINSIDALLIQKHVVGSRVLRNSYLDASDTNHDGKVNSIDALLVQKQAVGSYNIKSHK